MTVDPDLVITMTADPWEAVADTAASAANLRLRSDLMIAIREEIDRLGLTQTGAAARLGVTQPRLSDLYRGKIERFSLDALVNLAAGVGLRLSVSSAA